MTYLAKSVAATLLLGPFKDNTDGITDEDGLAGTMTVYLSKAGAAMAARNSSDSITYDARGYYLVPLNGTDTNTYGQLKVIVAETGVLQVWESFEVIDETVLDALRADAPLEVSVVAFNADSASAAAAEDFFTNQTLDLSNVTIGADVVKISGGATAADNAELAFDGTGYTFPNSTFPADVIALDGNTTHAARLKAMMDTIATGTAVTGTLTSTVFTTSITGSNDKYNGRWLFFRSGALEGQARQITDFANSGGTFTVASAFTTTPSNNDLIAVI